MKKLPKIIQNVGFDFQWDEKKVWKLEIPIEKMETKELEWNAHIPFWSSQNGYYNLKPIQVLESPAKYKEEYQRIMNAKLNYPLDIMFWKDRWVFLDGLHRFMKSLALKIQTVDVRKVPQEVIPLIKK